MTCLDSLDIITDACNADDHQVGAFPLRDRIVVRDGQVWLGTAWPG